MDIEYEELVLKKLELLLTLEEYEQLSDADVDLLSSLWDDLQVKELMIKCSKIALRKSAPKLQDPLAGMVIKGPYIVNPGDPVNALQNIVYTGGKHTTTSDTSPEYEKHKGKAWEAAVADSVPKLDLVELKKAVDSVHEQADRRRDWQGNRSTSIGMFRPD